MSDFNWTLDPDTMIGVKIGDVLDQIHKSCPVCRSVQLDHLVTSGTMWMPRTHECAARPLWLLFMPVFASMAERRGADD